MYTEDLNIFRATEKLTLTLIDILVNFPKDYKFTIGDRLLNQSLDLFEYISLANRFPEKRALYIDVFLSKFESVNCLIRICEEKKFVSILQAANLIEICNSIGKLANAWKKAALDLQNLIG